MNLPPQGGYEQLLGRHKDLDPLFGHKHKKKKAKKKKVK